MRPALRHTALCYCSGRTRQCLKLGDARARVSVGKRRANPACCLLFGPWAPLQQASAVSCRDQVRGPLLPYSPLCVQGLPPPLATTPCSCLEPALVGSYMFRTSRLATAGHQAVEFQSESRQLTELPHLQPPAHVEMAKPSKRRERHTSPTRCH